MEWYFVETDSQGESVRKGPWSSQQMLLFAAQGEITPQTLVWHAALASWTPWEEQASHARTEADSQVTEVEKPVRAPVRNYAGFWIRTVALLIDSFILQLFYLILQPLLNRAGLNEQSITESDSMYFLALSISIQLFISGFYHIWFVKKYAGTPGKILLGLSIVTADGQPMSWGTATVRFLSSWLSSLTLGIGYLVAAFDPEKRTLHDHLAKTRVLRR